MEKQKDTNKEKTKVADPVQSEYLGSGRTVIFEKNPLTDQMLQDAATVKTKQADVTYLKKVEM